MTYNQAIDFYNSQFTDQAYEMPVRHLSSYDPRTQIWRMANEKGFVAYVSTTLKKVWN